MNDSIYQIPVLNLLLAVGLVLVVGVIYLRWSMKAGTVLYATSRMLVQLILIGYVLSYIFESDSISIILGVLCIMLFAASWIALRPIKARRREYYGKALIAISVGGILTLALVTQGVIGLDPWYQPHYMIPLAGMIFSNSMNVVSLSAERFEAEIGRGEDYVKARNTAFQAGLIPLTNALFAVGLVSVPGMMTGQILSGISPLIAARYQIMVMCMVFGAGGISSALYLRLLKKN